MKRTVLNLLLAVICISSWAQRPQALKSSSIPASRITQINVSPGGNVSDAFHNALAQHYVAGNTTNYIQFNIPRGTYELSNIRENAVFRVAGKNNVIINGNGSTIIGRQLLRFFECNNSRNVILKNFYVDYNPLPFSQGTVQAVNVAGKYIDVTIDRNYPNPITDSRFRPESSGGINAKLWLFIKDPTERGMMKRGCENVYVINSGQRWRRSPANSNQMRVYLRSMTNIAQGDKWVMPISTAKNLIRINNSEQVTVEDVTQYTGAGALIYSGNSSMTNFFRLKSMLKPNTDRLQANTRDGAIFSANTIGPLFDGCVIEANGDDGINMNVSGNSLTYVNHGRKEVRMRAVINQFGNYPSIDMEAGDSIVFYSPSREKEIHRGTVRSITKTTVNGVKKATCVLNERIPNNLTTTGGDILVWSITRASNYFVVKNSTFRYLRRQAIFLYGRHGIVEGNTFEKITVRAIETHSQDRLGYLPENVIIRNNVFKDNNVSETDYSSGRGAPVAFELTTNRADNGRNSNAGKPIQNISIRDNVFEENFSNPAIIMTNCGNSSVRNNTFQSFHLPTSDVERTAVIVEDADVAYSRQNNNFRRRYYDDAQLIRMNFSVRSNQIRMYNNEINTGHSYHRLKVAANGNISIPKFGNTGYHLPDMLAKQALGSNPRTIQLRFKFGRDIRRSNSAGANIFTLGQTALGKYFRLYVTSDKRIVLDLGGNKYYRTRALSKNFSTTTKIQIAVARNGVVRLKVDDRAVAWAATPSNVSLNTAASDFALFTNNTSLGGATIYSFRVWNYDIDRGKSATVEVTEEVKNKVSFYPNPVRTELNIEAKDMKVNEIKVYSITGQEVMRLSVNQVGDWVKLDCSALKNGTYILRLLSDTEAPKHIKFQKRN